MRAIVWLWIALVSIQSQANEIQDAETQRLRAEQQLKTLKRDVQLDAKKLKVIESELNRLNSESKKLTREIASSEQVLRDLSETQQETENTIVSRTADLQRLLDQYRNELVAYYVTGRTLRPNTTDQGHLSEYLPFLLDARQKNAAEIEATANNLRSLLVEQERNTNNAQKTLLDLTDARDALSQRTRDQRQLLASISRNLRTKQQREDALNSDLQSLDRRIKSLQLESGGAALEPLKGSMQWPVDGRVLRRFGQNRQDGFGDWQGLVISATDGSEVRAVQAGKVAYAGYLLGYGLVIVIAHNDGHATIYGHNQSLKVETGQAVLARQVIAIAGNTGSLDVTALYFGVTRNGKSVNPSSWLN
ncbi:peptidoglycan DD-metalloendopeptidase family protein [Litoricolaceae bacterium]|nr:peptidoglycan DD-metalloendopeptidase family protein [Litorivicinaceae bacterium]MDB2424229.1 peptidoglycan DD-metalloendopeptidase family protein [Litorivicinaceae bacterium]